MKIYPQIYQENNMYIADRHSTDFPHYCNKVTQFRLKNSWYRVVQCLDTSLVLQNLFFFHKKHESLVKCEWSVSDAESAESLQEQL